MIGSSVFAPSANAGVGAVTRYRGVPPYQETRDYIAKVQALHASYRLALARDAVPSRGRAAP